MHRNTAGKNSIMASTDSGKNTVEIMTWKAAKIK